MVSCSIQICDQSNCVIYLSVTSIIIMILTAWSDAGKRSHASSRTDYNWHHNTELACSKDWLNRFSKGTINMVRPWSVYIRQETTDQWLQLAGRWSKLSIISRLKILCSSTAQKIEDKKVKLIIAWYYAQL